MTHESLLKRYANRGVPRGAKTVFEGAKSQPMSCAPERQLLLGDLETTPGRSLLRPVLIACTVVTVGVVGFVAIQAQEEERVTEVEVADGSSDAAPLPEDSDGEVPTTLPPSGPLPGPGDDAVEVAPGWMAYLVDARADEVGYVRTTEFTSDLNGIPVFAAPDGKDLRGYAVPYLGFVDRATYETPGFDLERHAREVLGDAAVDRYHEDFGIPPR